MWAFFCYSAPAHPSATVLPCIRPCCHPFPKYCCCCCWFCWCFWWFRCLHCDSSRFPSGWIEKLSYDMGVTGHIIRPSLTHDCGKLRQYKESSRPTITSTIVHDHYKTTNQCNQPRNHDIDISPWGFTSEPFRKWSMIDLGLDPNNHRQTGAVFGVWPCKVYCLRLKKLYISIFR